MLTEIEPEALVTDVQLGDYNGLHLVAIAQVEHPRTTCVVVGPRDPALQSESYHLGARYLVEPIAADRVAAILAELVATPRPQRRWPRKRPAQEVPTFVSGIEARIVDVSYGGAGIEVYSDDLPAETAAHRARDRHGGAGRAGLGPPHLQGAAVGVRCRAAARQRRGRPVAVVRGRPGADARVLRRCPADAAWACRPEPPPPGRSATPARPLVPA